MTVLFGKRATCGNIFRCNEENLDQENKTARSGEKKTQKQVLMKKNCFLSNTCISRQTLVKIHMNSNQRMNKF